MIRLAREVITVVVLSAALSQAVHLMLIGLAVVDPSRLPQ